MGIRNKASTFCWELVLHSKTGIKPVENLLKSFKTESEIQALVRFFIAIFGDLLKKGFQINSMY